MLLVPNNFSPETVETGIYAAFGKDWVVAIALLLQSPSPAGWQGVVLYMLNIKKVNPEIQLEVEAGLVNTNHSSTHLAI